MGLSRAEIERNLAAIRGRLDRACERSGRDVDTIMLVAAAKTQPAEPIRGWSRRV